MSTLRTDPVTAEFAIKVAVKLDANVFPASAAKTPITHGKDWREVSTSDPESIRRLWKLAGGSAYVAVDCGKSALTVIDIDNPEAVPTALLDVLRANPTLEIMSVTKGQPHYYYRGIAAGRPIPGGDIKGVGGYVICSPDPDLKDREIADTPHKLIELFDLSLVPDTAPPTRGEPGSPPAVAFDPHDPLTTFFATYDHTDLEGSIGQAFLDRVTSDTFPNKVRAGMHRRQAARDVVLQAALEAASGFYSARDAYLQIEDTYQNARDIDPNPHKQYNRQREQDYETLWQGAAAKILSGYYDVEILTMRADKGLYDYDPFPDGEDSVPPPPDISPAKTEEPPEEKPASTETRHPDLESDSKTPAPAEAVTHPAPPKDGKPEPSVYDPKLEPDWETATSGEPPPPPPIPTWTDGGYTLPIDRRLYRDGDLIGSIPKLSDDVNYGNLGELLRVFDGATEAPLPSIGTALLPMLGGVLGRSVRFVHGDITLPVNLFSVLVAPTGLGRKSTALGAVKLFIDKLEPGFSDENCWDGIASGQVLVSELSDPVFDKTGTLKRGREDQRLVLNYDEFQGLLAAIGYEGSTLGGIIRTAYDQRGPLRYSSMQHGRRVSSGHHLSLSAAITPTELLTYFPKLSAADGLGNRMAWCYSDEEILMPDGGHIDMTRLDELATRMRATMGLTSYAGAATTRIRFSPEVEERWRDSDYATLRRKGVESGSLGSMLSRQTSHVLRVATIYSVCDGSDLIQTGHYQAGRAWADFSENTVTALFGGMSRSPVAAEVLASVREHPGSPTTRSALSSAFGRHRTAEQLTAALDRLIRAGFVHTWRGESEGRGRRAEHIIATMPRHE